MKNSRVLLIAATAALLMIVATPAGAQSAGTSITLSTPTIHKGNIWLKGEVVHADARSIMVREQGNPLSIHTFTYAEPIQGQMQQIAEAGGYQYGDHVKILYFPGQQIALKIHGKPSKPS
jgi:hypothetical protein